MVTSKVSVHLLFLFHLAFLLNNRVYGAVVSTPLFVSKVTRLICSEAIVFVQLGELITASLLNGLKGTLVNSALLLENRESLLVLGKACLEPLLLDVSELS